MNTKASVGRGLAILAVALCAAAWSPAYGQYTYFVSDWSDGEVFADASIETDFSDYLWAAAVEVDVYDPNGTVIASGANEAEACVDEGVDAYAEVEVTAETSQEGWYSSLAYYWIWDVLEDDWESDGYDYAWSYAYPPGSGPPSIDHISPTSIAYGAGDGYGSPYGYVGVYGTNLDSGGDSCVTVSFGTCYWASDTQVNIQYDESVGTGTYQISVTDDVGASSNSVPFTITGDSTPSNISLNYTTWVAGQTYTDFAITGSGFGSNQPPSGSSGVTLSCCASFTLGSWSDTSITGTLVVASDAPQGSVTVTVGDTGYNGFGFQAGQQGNSSNGSTTAQVQANAPAPRILLNGQDVTNTTQMITIGQQIVLTGANNGGPGASPTWSLGENYVGGFNPTVASSGVQGVNLNAQNVTYYYYGTGTANIFYQLTGANGLPYSGSATFTVVGPNAGTGTGAGGPGAIVVDSTCLDENNVPFFSVHYGGCGATAGMTFQSVPDSNFGGSYEWIQVATNVQNTADGTSIKSCVNQIDNTLPYDTAPATQDSPGQGISTTRAGYSIADSFNMFLMYNPDPAGGTAIYVPLIVWPWSWSVSVSASSGWVPSSPSTTYTRQRAAGFPEWTGACTNSN